MQPPTRVIAIDWSGQRTHEEGSIHRAECVDGALIGVDSGLSRGETVEWLVREAARTPRLVVGLDFAFSLPEWFLRRRGAKSVGALWRLVEDEGEDWLDGCEPPFWGRPGRKRPREDEKRQFRRTEMEMRAVRRAFPKSVFQIGGAGAVGTASLRGMPWLRLLRDAGFSIWPFDPKGWPRVVEIYPRALTGPVRKSREKGRSDYLARYVDVAAGLRADAAKNEHAFDAVVSAIEMSRHADRLVALRRERDYALEGRIWPPA
jgi:hypothetical protein